MTSVFISGAGGFIGRSLTEFLIDVGCDVIAGTRNPELFDCARRGVRVQRFALERPELSAESLRDVDTIIHLAAKVHVLAPSSRALETFRLLNASGPCRTAEIAAKLGVRRFIFVSSAKVFGDESFGRPFTPSDVPCPKDQYGQSKLDAERGLTAIAQRTGIELAIVRPPLVFGPGVKANFLRLLDLVSARIPLPLKSVDNRRSLVNVWNLCDLLRLLTVHEKAAGKTWLVSDDEDTSTAELVTRIGDALGQSARLWRCPVSLLRAAATLVGRRADFNRLCGSLQLDIGDTKSVLGWVPPTSMNKGIERTVEWYLRKSRS